MFIVCNSSALAGGPRAVLRTLRSYFSSRSQSILWLLEGDLNTGFFHRIANGKRRKNTIFSIQNDGMEVDETCKILDLAIEYYKGLFGQLVNSDIKLD